MKFYLGTHVPSWLGKPEFAGVPLFISHNTLKNRKSMPKAVTRWALDSGGFTQLSSNEDGWPKGSEEPYVEKVRFYRTAGGLDFASPQDWMCEPWLMNGRTVQEHQERTVENYLKLRELAPDIPWLPVLQGWDLRDYVTCVGTYMEYGVDLREYPRVGVGSVCRRQATDDIGAIFKVLDEGGISCHGFGVKMKGLEKYGHHLGSADSMAWSFGARHKPPLPGCSHGKDGTGNCANCSRYALRWRRQLLDILDKEVAA